MSFNYLTGEQIKRYGAMNRDHLQMVGMINTAGADYTNSVFSSGSSYNDTTNAMLGASIFTTVLGSLAGIFGALAPVLFSGKSGGASGSASSAKKNDITLDNITDYGMSADTVKACEQAIAKLQDKQASLSISTKEEKARQVAAAFTEIKKEYDEKTMAVENADKALTEATGKVDSTRKSYTEAKTATAEAQEAYDAITIPEIIIDENGNTTNQADINKAKAAQDTAKLALDAAKKAEKKAKTEWDQAITDEAKAKTDKRDAKKALDDITPNYNTAKADKEAADKALDETQKLAVLIPSQIRELESKKAQLESQKSMKKTKTKVKPLKLRNTLPDEGASNGFGSNFA